MVTEGGGGGGPRVPRHTAPYSRLLACVVLLLTFSLLVSDSQSIVGDYASCSRTVTRRCFRANSTCLFAKWHSFDLTPIHLKQPDHCCGGKCTSDSEIRRVHAAIALKLVLFSKPSPFSLRSLTIHINERSKSVFNWGQKGPMHREKGISVAP